MQQLYLVEVFVDKITLFGDKKDVKKPEDKKPEEDKTKTQDVVVRTKFGPDVEFVFHQGRQCKEKITDFNETDVSGTKLTKYYRCGNSILFPSYASVMDAILRTYPLEIDLWNNIENEQPELIGVGKMHWNTEFFMLLKATAKTCNIPPGQSMEQSKAIKENVPIMQECCCVQVGEAHLILRIYALGDSIVTDFQQIEQNPDQFVFRTDKYDNVFQCERVESENAEYIITGGLYEVTKRDPRLVKFYEKRVEVCTELEACKFGEHGLDDEACDLKQHEPEPEKKKRRIIDKIRMGDIAGPCGNKSCAVAHRVKNYIRNIMPEYQRAPNYPSARPKVICGKCACKPDRFNAKHLSDKELMMPLKKKPCGPCGGKIQEHETCAKKIKKHYGTGHTPPGSETNIKTVNYMTETTRFQNPLFFKEYIVNNLTTKYFNEMMEKEKRKARKRNPNPELMKKSCGCCEGKFLDHISNIPTPIYNIAPICPTTPVVPFTGGFECTKKTDSVTDTKIDGSPASGYNSMVTSEQVHPVSGCSCGKQQPLDSTEIGLRNIGSILPSSRCGCGKQQPFHLPKTPIFSSGCGCSTRKPNKSIESIQTGQDSKSLHSSHSNSQKVSDSSISLQKSASSQNDQGSSSTNSVQSNIKENSENVDNTSDNDDNNAPEIRFLQVEYRRPDLVTPMVYNTTEVKPHGCLSTSALKECKCNPPRPTAACETLDCNCITETIEIASRKNHKPYCFLYKHKKTCPVTMQLEEEQPEEEGGKEEVEPLPYGLPPIQLGPCPVIGRPCSVPDGFARMYKNAADVLPQPPSYDEAGKICCSKEFERIKKAINEYLKEQKVHDMRCINRYNVDTEKRCCDKEQALLALIGRSCCGSHKMAIQEKFKEKKPEKNPSK